MLAKGSSDHESAEAVDQTSLAVVNDEIDDIALIDLTRGQTKTKRTRSSALGDFISKHGRLEFHRVELFVLHLHPIGFASYLAGFHSRELNL